MSRPEINLGIVGATGLVGERILHVAQERDFPAKADGARFFASEKSAGQTMNFMGREYSVEYAEEADFEGLDVVLLSAGAEISRELSPRIAAAGAIAIDNSSAWRKDDEVPLVVAEVNPEELDDIPKGIVANPNCTTMIAMPALKALDDEAGLKKVIMSSYQAVSGSGRKGLAELVGHTSAMITDEQALDYLVKGGFDPDKLGLTVDKFPASIGFNVMPKAGGLPERDSTEELKFINESRKILGLADLAIDATCVRVPVLNGHSLSLTVKLRQKLSAEDAEEILAQTAGVQLEQVPTPVTASGEDDVIVGRVRESRVFSKGLDLFISGDNLRKGAALNAVQLAELVVDRHFSDQ